MESETNIYVNFSVTVAQAEKIAKHFNVDLNSLKNYEICTYLDRIIDEEL